MSLIGGRHGVGRCSTSSPSARECGPSGPRRLPASQKVPARRRHTQWVLALAPGDRGRCDRVTVRCMAEGRPGQARLTANVIVMASRLQKRRRRLSSADSDADVVDVSLTAARGRLSGHSLSEGQGRVRGLQRWCDCRSARRARERRWEQCQ